MLPPTLVLVFGDAPVARALVRVGAALDYDVRADRRPGAPLPPTPPPSWSPRTAATRSGAGRGAAGRRARTSALVASRGAGGRRCSPALDVDRRAAARGCTPRPGWTSARAPPPEIALSIYAEIVARRPRPHRRRRARGGRAAPRRHRPGVRHDGGGRPGDAVAWSTTGGPVYFCGPGCREAFAADPARYRGDRTVPADVDALRAGLDATGYLADDALATALFLAVRMRQPILLEGEPGVGQDRGGEGAGRRLLDTPLLRLQCYEGLTAAEALYEWNYPRQLLAIRLAESRGERLRDADLFTPEYLLARPLLAAHRPPRAAAGGAADRRGGPGRRRVRGVPVRAARRGRGDDPGAGHPAGASCRRSRCSPPTAPATCTTRSSAAASTTGSATREPARVAEIIRRRVPGGGGLAGRRGGRRGAAAARAGPAQAARASPRRSAGRTALHVLGVDRRWTPTAADRTLGAVLKYDEDAAAGAGGRARRR